MHILIVSGEGDLRGYIQDTGIGLNFIRVNDIDSFPSSILRSEIHEIAIYASSISKGICFTSNRQEISNIILEHFKNNNNIIEQIHVHKNNSISVRR